jgi:acetyltransferase-like isoleucine patch superfamily enzyme
MFRLLYCLNVGARSGLIWALRFFWYEPLFRSQCVSVGPGLEMEQMPFLVGNGVIVIGDRVKLSGMQTIRFYNRLHSAPQLRVGDDTFIGHHCRFSVSGSVTIGRHCLLARGITVNDFDGHVVDADRRRENATIAPADSRPIVIEDDVWIGTNAVILKGVTIGRRAIVGAGAVVFRDVPPDAVVMGNPAQVVGLLHTSAKS